MYWRRTFGCTTPCFAAELPWRCSISSSLHHGQKTIHVGICITIDPLRCRLQRELENSHAVIPAMLCSRFLSAIASSAPELPAALPCPGVPCGCGTRAFYVGQETGASLKSFSLCQVPAAPGSCIGRGYSLWELLTCPHRHSVSLWFSLVAHNADETRKNPFCSASQCSSMVMDWHRLAL